MALRLAAIVLGLLVVLPDALAEELDWSPPLEVARVLAAERLELVDGRSIRLAGIRVPATVAGQAQALLAELVANRALRLGTSPAPFDRYGDLVAQVERADGLWLQGALLERGLAQVRTRPDEVARAAAMLGLEQAARAAGRGLWRQPGLAARPADQLADAIGSFQIVQGRVLRVAPTEDYVYLNFGQDWRSDFTLRLRRAELDASFARSPVDVLALAGRRVEVRGFVLNAGGPLIELSHPEQIQVLP
ncbi:MAG TPA: thermonuclease family protein [Geminicoccaceae bacterium]|nr:thermonuclease family protein [Geminicoccaceae bacterium]